MSEELWQRIEPPLPRLSGVAFVGLVMLAVGFGESSPERHPSAADVLSFYDGDRSPRGRRASTRSLERVVFGCCLNVVEFELGEQAHVVTPNLAAPQRRRT